MKYRVSVGDVIFNILNYTFFILLVLVCVFPFYYLFINTISDNTLVGRGQIYLIPRGVHFDNYARVINLRGFGDAVRVSLLRTIIGPVLSVICTGWLAFTMTRKEYWKRKLWYRFFIVTMYFNAGLIPTYLNLRMLGLFNTFTIYVIGVISVFGMILFKTYIESLPVSLSESAEIDGAGYFRIYFRIIFPLCKPIIATLLVFGAVNHWNDFMTTQLYITEQRLFTLQYILRMYLNEASRLAADIMAAEEMGVHFGNRAATLTPSSVRMTISMVVAFPILCVYPLFQRFFVKGIMIGAIKG